MSTQQGLTIQTTDELASGQRAKRLYLRHNILDNCGRFVGCPVVTELDNTQRSAEQELQEMVDKGDAISKIGAKSQIEKEEIW